MKHAPKDAGYADDKEVDKEKNAHTRRKKRRRTSQVLRSTSHTATTVEKRQEERSQKKKKKKKGGGGGWLLCLNTGKQVRESFRGREASMETGYKQD